MEQRMDRQSLQSSSERSGLLALLSGTLISARWRLLRTIVYLRDEVFPCLLGTHHQARCNTTRILVSWGCLAAAVVLFSQPCSSGQRLIKTTGWSLTQFVDHLDSRGLGLHVVPTHKSGNWSNSIYLAADPEASWPELQKKSRSLERIEQWHGVVLLERLTNGPGPKWDVEQWGENGLQIDRFVLFGDAELIRKIGQSVVEPKPRCILSRWLSNN
jgi:hypothetical protein